MARRIQSPSSINMYKRCPRKYYLHYILRKPTKPSIHLYRGSIVHSAINQFEKLGIKTAIEADFQPLRAKLHIIYKNEWKKQAQDILKLHLQKEELLSFYTESLQMLDNWLQEFISEHARGPPQKKVELKLFSSPEYSIMGIVDVIKEDENGIAILDYKTAKDPVLSDEYKLQLAMYALLYEESFKKRPTQVGIHFLKYKDGIKMIEVDDGLLNLAKKEAKLIHINTMSNDPKDYPCTCGGWCERDFI